MIENHPTDENEKLLMFPGAARPRGDGAHAAVMLAHLADMALMDSGYARWRARELERDNRLWYAGLFDALDVELAARGIPLGKPYVEPTSRLPALVTGRRGLPKKRFFHE